MVRIEKQTAKRLAAALAAMMVLTAPSLALADETVGGEEVVLAASAARGTLDDPIPITFGEEVSQTLKTSEGQEFTTYYEIELPEDGYIQLVDTPHPRDGRVMRWSLQVLTSDHDSSSTIDFTSKHYGPIKMGLSAGRHIVRSDALLSDDTDGEVTLSFKVGYVADPQFEDESAEVSDIAPGMAVKGDINGVGGLAVDYDYFRFTLDEPSRVSVSYSSSDRKTALWEFGPTMPSGYKWKVVLVSQDTFDASISYPIEPSIDGQTCQYDYIMQNALLSNLDKNGNSIWPEGDEVLKTDEVTLNAGTYYVCLTANYKLGIPEDYSFTVNAKSLVPSVVDAEVGTLADQVFTGKAIEPKPTVTLDGAALVEGTDYDISYAHNVNPGTASITITGKGNYKGEKNLTFKIVAPAKSFPDVKDGAWYEKVVNRAAALGLVGGYANGDFGPDDNITRAQVAVILWRMAGQPKAGVGGTLSAMASAKSFPDVRSGAYYYNAVAWASSAGVVSGYANGKFGPDDKVTREQLAVMLANYARRVGKKTVVGSVSDYASMKDASKVAGYATTAVGWCFRNKILSGSQGNVLPKGNATRAQAAKMLVGLYDLVG